MSGGESDRVVRCAVSIVAQRHDDDVPAGGVGLKHWLSFVMASSAEDAKAQAEREFKSLFKGGGYKILGVLIERVPA